MRSLTRYRFSAPVRSISFLKKLKLLIRHIDYSGPVHPRLLQKQQQRRPIKSLWSIPREVFTEVADPSIRSSIFVLPRLPSTSSHPLLAPEARDRRFSSTSRRENSRRRFGTTTGDFLALVFDGTWTMLFLKGAMIQEVILHSDRRFEGSNPSGTGYTEENCN